MPLLPAPVLVKVKAQSAAVTAVTGTVMVAVVGLVTFVTNASAIEPIVALVMSVVQAPVSAVYEPPVVPEALLVLSETVAPYWKPEPSKVIVYEPTADSAEGLAFSRPLPTVKALASVAEPPSVFVIVTSNAPGVAAAEFAGFVGVTLRTMDVALTDVTEEVKAVPSTWFVMATVAPVAKPVPVMVTVVGPVASQTSLGLIELTCGGASSVAAPANEALAPFASVKTAEQVPAAVPVAVKLAVPVPAPVSATEVKTRVPAVQVATNVSLVAPLFAKPEPVKVAVPVDPAALTPVLLVADP
jgi:hypothetical protein